MDHHVTPGTGSVYVIDQTTARIVNRLDIIGYITKISGGRIETDILALDSDGYPTVLFEDININRVDCDIVLVGPEPAVNADGIPLKVMSRRQRHENELLAKKGRQS